jgi:hypothetical protein
MDDGGGILTRLHTGKIAVTCWSVIYVVAKRALAKEESIL